MKNDARYFKGSRAFRERNKKFFEGEDYKGEDLVYIFESLAPGLNAQKQADRSGIYSTLKRTLQLSFSSGRSSKLPEYPLKGVDIHILTRRRRLLEDEDNLRAVAKPFLDILQSLGILRNDGMQYIGRVEVEQATFLGDSETIITLKRKSP